MKVRILFFAFNNRRKRPGYVFKEKNGKYYNILTTQSKEDKKRKNIPLYKNPSPNDNSKAYIQKRVYVMIKKHFGKIYNNWKFHLFDKRKIKRIKKKGSELNKKLISCIVSLLLITTLYSFTSVNSNSEVLNDLRKRLII